MMKTGYLAGMEDIGSEMMERTLALREGFCEEASEADVQRAISAKNRGLRDFAALLSVRAGEHLEQIAQASVFRADRPLHVRLARLLTKTLAHSERTLHYLTSDILHAR